MRPVTIHHLERRLHYPLGNRRVTHSVLLPNPGCAGNNNNKNNNNNRKMQLDPTEFVQTFVYDMYLKRTASCYSVFNNDPLKVILLPLMTVMVYRTILRFFFPRLCDLIAWMESMLINVLYAVVLITIMSISMKCDV